MDKQYNVDDILSEIKSRKSRTRSEQGQPEGEARPGGTARKDFTLRLPDEREAVSQANPDSTTGEFRFEPPVRERSRNPLDFDGHVRSITDKAKMRHEQRETERSISVQQEQRPERPPQATGRLDFSSFRASAGEEGTQERTRVLPKFGFSRELKLEDVQRMDFSGVAGDALDDNDEYYEANSFGMAPDAPAIDFSEYNSVNDRKDVATDIARVKLWLFIRCGVTALLTALLFYIVFAGKYVMWLPGFMDPETNVRVYLMASAVLTVLVALVNSSPMGGGIINMFKMRANSDTLAAFAVLAAIGQSAVWVYRYESVDPMKLNLYCSVAALTMLFNALGKFSMISRIQHNFRIIASDRPKKAVMVAQSDAFCRDFVRDASRNRPTVAYSARADFLTDFLALSYSDKYDVGINRAVAPVCLLGALAVGVITRFLTGDPSESVAALAAVLCVCATLSSSFIENIPLGKLTKRLAPQGGMVSGNKAVEDFCDTAAVVLSEMDVFPEGTVQLHGIKTYSRGRVDEAILDAASVICSLDSALSPVFLQMIGGDRKLLKKVDNVVYENGLGISAWVDSRRILIGNRMLMLNHGIVLSAESYEQKYADQQGESIYLSNSGELSAQFVVSYRMDEELAVQLDALAAREKTLVVYAVDPHITPKKLWEIYGFPQELCRVMAANRHAEYRDMTKPRENAIAEIAYTGKAHTMLAALVSCMNARASILSATMLQMIQIIIGYGLVTFLAFMSSIGTLTIGTICIYQLFWFAVTFILQQLRSS